MKLSLIAAKAKNNVIGNKGQIPWHISADFKHFKDITTGHHIIMGQTTFESIGHALPNRTNIILTFDKAFQVEGCIVAHSLEDALRIAETNGESEAFIIGGGSVYRLSIDRADKLYITEINEDFEGDTYFPNIDTSIWKEIKREKHLKTEGNDYNFDFVEYER